MQRNANELLGSFEGNVNKFRSSGKGSETWWSRVEKEAEAIADGPPTCGPITANRATQFTANLARQTLVLLRNLHHNHWRAIGFTANRTLQPWRGRGFRCKPYTTKWEECKVY